MRIITDHIDQAFAHVMRAQEAASTIYARVIILRLSLLPEKSGSLYTRLLPAILSLFGDPEGKILRYEDDDTVIVSRLATQRIYVQFCDLLESILPEDITPTQICLLYELPAHSEYVERFLAEKAARTNAKETKTPIDHLKPVQEKIVFKEPLFAPEVLSSIAQRRKNRPELVIQLIEDDAFSQRIINNILRNQCSVVTSGTGEQALYHYAIHTPDVVFLDIGLPDINGQKLLERLLHLDANAYVIMLSGQGSRDNVLKALEKGARGFIGKPFSNRKLVHFINQSPFSKSKQKSLGELHV